MAYVVFLLILLMAKDSLQPFAVASPQDHVELLEEHARSTEGRAQHQNETKKILDEKASLSF